MQNLEFDEFDKLIETANSIRVIKLNKDNWKLSTCTCSFFAKNYKCNHVIAIAARKNLFTFQPKAMQIQVGQVRKRGRPVNTIKALILQPNEPAVATVQAQAQAQDEVVETDIEITRNPRKKKRTKAKMVLARGENIIFYFYLFF